MTQKQLHHQKALPQTADDSRKLQPGSSQHSVQAVPPSKKISPLQQLARVSPETVCCFSKAGKSR